jgi:hypothetical protein
MAARKCPMCLKAVPAGFVVAYTNGMDCPGCGQRLEVSLGSRYLASLAGILAGALVWRRSDPSQGQLGFATAVLWAFLAYSVVAPLVLMLIADLRAKAAEPVAEPAPAAAHGHGGGHH